MRYQQAIDYLRNRTCTDCRLQQKTTECTNEKCGYKQAMDKAIDAMETMIVLGQDKECEACKI